MNVVFISNYYTHHQMPLSNALYELTEGNYIFIATEQMSYERKEQGWEIESPNYVHELQKINGKDRNKYIDLINQADVVIQGSLCDWLIEERTRLGKLTFIYNERLYKSIKRYLKIPYYLYKCIKYRNCYILSASAYLPFDYSKTRSYLNRCYKFGYFPTTKYYSDIEDLFSKKKNNQIVWVARLIEWKHPEHAIYVASVLKEHGYDFQLNIIGTGPMENRIKRLIDHYQLMDNVHLLGSMSPEDVRKYMEESDIFLMTSDRNEGWGAVINEAMNSGCAVVASHEIGAVPYLINDGYNGCIYNDGDISCAIKCIEKLIDNPHYKKDVGKRAIQTICETWNAAQAASNLITLANYLNTNREPSSLVGPCSKAEIIKDNWFICQ